MVATNQGLTQTYNRLKDPDCADPEIVALRDLHVEMDRRVLSAYGWSDIDVPPYTTPATDAEPRALALFEDTVIDRLFALNAARAAAEDAAEAARAPAPAPRRAKPTRAQPSPAGQATLADIIPFPHVDRPKPGEKYQRYIPLYDIRVAAGDFSEFQERHIESWIAPPTSIPFTKRMFAARIQGRSMEPAIPDGAYALFEAPWLTPQKGVVGLFTNIASTDPDTGAHITVKRYNPQRGRLDGDPHIAGTLDPGNAAYSPIPITESTRPFARLITVLRLAD